MKLTELLVPGAEAVVKRYRVLYEEEKAICEAMVADAHNEHSSLPNNFWHKKEELWNKLKTAEQLLETYKELQK